MGLNGPSRCCSSGNSSLLAVGFDSAWWGIANLTAGPASVMQGTLHRLPPEFVEDWWQIADVDALARLCAEHPGMTVLDDALRACTPQEEAFDARYGLSCALSTALPDYAIAALREALPIFGRQIPRYDDPDAFDSVDAGELFPIGSMVRHPIFGVGKVEYLARGFGGTRARISFRSVGLKTLIVEHAKLSRA